jgi:oxygen-independent coproporphyrinogen-3 oxidase
MTLSRELIRKYNQPVPRYTSYPTVPYWDGVLHPSDWGQLVRKAFHTVGKDKGITLYIHLPFCESLCTYCGCTKRITKNHRVELPYLEALLREWSLYLELFGETPKISGIHLGGGTPTFFSPENLSYLLSEVLKSAHVFPDAEFSFEGHPNNTTAEHLEQLARLGFNRVSYGIQDFDPDVQRAIHRIQPFEKVKEATENAREFGYSSVNFDLIYGLPHQNLDTLAVTFDKVAELLPERIAFYSYAHLPSAFPAQKSFEAFLPDETRKRQLYEFGKEKLVAMGYKEVGMDHFALPEDPLWTAKRNGKLHRNFMGYTTSPSEMLLGLGASSISDIGLAFAQNEKSTDAYLKLAEEAQLPIVRGHVQTETDRVVRKLIMELICREKAEIPEQIQDELLPENLENLDEMEKDELINRIGSVMTVTPKGKALVRNICSQFDLRMSASKVQKSTFSKAI